MADVDEDVIKIYSANQVLTFEQDIQQPFELEYPFQVAFNPQNVVVDWKTFHPDLKRLFAQPVYAQGTPEWFAERMNGLSASDIGAVLKHQKRYPNDKYDPDERVFLLKTNQIPQDPDTEATLHGKLNEPFAGEYYSKRQSMLTFNIGLIKDAQVPYLFASPDLLTTTPNLVEIKSPWRRRIKPWMDAKMMEYDLPHYYDQCQCQAKVTQLFNDLHFVQYGTKGNPYYEEEDVLTIHPIPYEPHWYPKHESEIANFWDRILRYREAHPDWKDYVWPKPDPVFAKTIARNIDDIIIDRVEERLIRKKRKGFGSVKAPSKTYKFNPCPENPDHAVKDKEKKTAEKNSSSKKYMDPDCCYLQVIDDDGHLIDDEEFLNKSSSQKPYEWVHPALRYESVSINHYKPISISPIKDKKSVLRSSDLIRSKHQKEDRNPVDLSSEGEKKKKKKKKLVCPFK